MNDPILDYNTQLKKLELHIFCGSELRSSFTLLTELSSQLQYVRYPIVDLWIIIILKNNRKIKQKKLESRAEKISVNISILLKDSDCYLGYNCAVNTTQFIMIYCGSCNSKC